MENNDVHIHVPAGAIPKDGPSAGVAMAVAMISAFTGKPVDHKVGMTGEISLRGRVMPVGGVKEKALGAVRAGLKTVLVPEKNNKDLVEMPKSVKEKLEFIKVKDLDQVVDLVFEQEEST